MERIIFTLLVVKILINSAFAQENSKFFLNEFAISINESLPSDGSFGQNIGFGLGVYHSLTTHKYIDLVFGVEYNRINQFQISQSKPYWPKEEVTYTTDNVSIPLSVRYIFGEHFRFYFETGLYGDLNLKTNKTGYLHFWVPSGSNLTEHRQKEINETVGTVFINFGFDLGIGCMIPISEKEILITFDYKYGFIQLNDEIYNRYLRLKLGFRL
jgi:hypothetical protein